MKRIISLILMLILLFTIPTGCGEEVDYTNPHIINFTMSERELKAYNGEIVQIMGYQTLTSNVDECIEYITPMPGQIYPEVEIDTVSLKNTIPVYTHQVADYTSRPVIITGKLVFGQFSDGNGTYSYNYKIENPKIKVASIDDVPEELKEYYEIASKEYPFELATLLYTAEAYTYYDVFELDPEIDLKDEINMNVFNEMKAGIKEAEGSAHKELLALWEKEEALLLKINKNVKDKKYDELLNYQKGWIELEQEIKTYFAKFKF